MFPHYRPMLNMWPQGRPFWPQEHILNKLGKNLLGIHTKYQGSRLSGFRQEDF